MRFQEALKTEPSRYSTDAPNVKLDDGNDAFSYFSAILRKASKPLAHLHGNTVSDEGR